MCHFCGLKLIRKAVVAVQVSTALYLSQMGEVMDYRGKLRQGLFCSLFALSSLAAPAPSPAVITLSDGTVLSGKLSIIGSRPLTLVPFGEDRQRMVLLSDILSIDHQIETNSMERPWVFKESGKAEKVYLDGQYPLLNFKTRITLVSGSVLSGHIISARISCT